MLKFLLCDFLVVKTIIIIFVTKSISSNSDLFCFHREFEYRIRFKETEKRIQKRFRF